MKKIEFGLVSFADMDPAAVVSKSSNAEQRIQNLLQEIKLADSLGLDVFGIGEHHREDYAVSSPVTVLAAAASCTKNIKLSSAVTVLSSEDPVRVYQQFATLDLISGGRAEIMAGRGSFTESFPLFGYDLNDYDSLFSEKLDLLLQINHSEKLQWQGEHRAAIRNLGIYPRALQKEIPIWLAVGGTPASAIRAATLKLPLMLAMIGGRPEQFVPFVNMYKNAAAKNGLNTEDLQLGINNHLFVGDNDTEIADAFFPYYKESMDRVGQSRGWQPMTRSNFDYMRSEYGSLMVGSVEKIVEKLLYEYKLFGFTRYLGQASLGSVPHELTMKSIELFATRVIPEFKRRLELSIMS